MATLKLSIDSFTPNTDITNNLAVLKVKFNDFNSMASPTNVVAGDLISSDTPNDIQTGSDGKLLACHQDIDFTAYYTLAKG